MKKILWMAMIMAALVLWAGIVTAAVNKYFVTEEVSSQTMATVDTSSNSSGTVVCSPLKKT